MKRRRHQPQPTAAGDQIELADLQEPLATRSPMATTPALLEDLPEAATVTQPLGQPDDPTGTTAGSPEPGRAEEEQAQQQISCWTRVLAGLLFLKVLIDPLYNMTLESYDIATDLLAGISYLSGGESFCELYSNWNLKSLSQISCCSLNISDISQTKWLKFGLQAQFLKMFGHAKFQLSISCIQINETVS